MISKKGPRARKNHITMAQRILAYRQEHPGVGSTEIALELGCHPTYCRQVLFKARQKGGILWEAEPAPQENGQDLAKTIKQVKALKQIGLERVRELLALLDAIQGK
jgi:hypothetical protein